MGKVSDFFIHHKQLSLLAIPIVLSNMGQMMVNIADTMMVGQLGTVELGIVSFSGMLIMMFIVVSMGFSVGLTPLVAKKMALGKKSVCIKLLENSLVLNTLLGTALAVILLLAYPLLGYLGQPQEVIDNMGGFYITVSLSIIPYTIFLSFKQFFEGMKNTRIAMLISVFCNLANILLNYLLIFGKFGFPELGVFGAGLATLISRLSMPIIFYTYMRFSRYKSLLPRISISRLNRKLQKILTLFGTPIAAQMLVEFFALTAITIMMGWLGIVELAANQITYTMISVMYLIVSGIAAAVTIMTAFEKGKNNIVEVKRYALSGVHLAIGLMSFSALTMIIFGKEIASMFTNDVAVISLAATYMIAIATVQIFDGIQVIFLGALRGIGDVKAPMYYAFILYGLICTIIAYSCGFIFNLGGVGIWLGFSFGLLVASFVYGRRFLKQLKLGFKN